MRADKGRTWLLLAAAAVFFIADAGEARAERTAAGKVYQERFVY